MNTEKHHLGTWVNAPLAFVQAVIAFPPLMDLANRIGKAHSAILERFPRFSQDVNVQIGGAGGAARGVTSFVYASADNTLGVRINANSITCQTVKYVGSQDFIFAFTATAKEILSALEVAHVVQTSFQTIDLFCPTGKRAASHVLVPSLRPWQPATTDVPGKIQMAQQVYQFVGADPHRMAVAHIHHEVGDVLPPGFDPIALALSKPQIAARDLLRAESRTRFTFLLINALHVLEIPAKVSAFNLVEDMTKLHGAGKQIFMGAVTADAISAWTAT